MRNHTDRRGLDVLSGFHIPQSMRWWDRRESGSNTNLFPSKHEIKIVGKARLVDQAIFLLAKGCANFVILDNPCCLNLYCSGTIPFSSLSILHVERTSGLAEALPAWSEQTKWNPNACALYSYIEGIYLSLRTEWDGWFGIGVIPKVMWEDASACKEAWKKRALAIDKNLRSRNHSNWGNRLYH